MEHMFHIVYRGVAGAGFADRSGIAFAGAAARHRLLHMVVLAVVESTIGRRRLLDTRYVGSRTFLERRPGRRGEAPIQHAMATYLECVSRPATRSGSHRY